MIRDARPDDLDAIVALIRGLADYEDMTGEVALDPAELREHLFGAAPVASALVATDGSGPDDPVVGYALFFPTYSTFLGRPGIWLEDLFVRSEARGRGHGRALIEALRGRTDGRLEWSVLEWNESAIGFYRSLGAGPVDGWITYRWPPGGSSRSS